MSFWRTLGAVVRQTGQAIDSLGCSLQGRYCYREHIPFHQTVKALGTKKPVLGEDTFVAPNASVIGEVTIGSNSSVWYGAILRGDVNSIKIGDNTNIQDGVVVHVARHTSKGYQLPTIIGNNVTIGHLATIHAATIEDGSLVGMGATLLDGSKVEKGAIVAAGSLVTQGSTVPSGEIWAGAPAKFLRKLEAGEAEFIAQSARNYAALAAEHAAENAKSPEEVEEDKRRREDRLMRDPDYDSHMGIERDPVTRQVTTIAEST